MSLKTDLQPVAVQFSSGAASIGSQVETTMRRYYHRVVLQNIGTTRDTATVWERIGSTDVVLLRAALGADQALVLENKDLERGSPIFVVRSDGYLRVQSGANTWNLSALYTDEY